MNAIVKLRLDRIEQSEIRGILAFHFSEINGDLSIDGELPESLIVNKLKLNSNVIIIISNDELSVGDLKKYGSPVIICEGILYKKAKEDDKNKYWISLHGFQFRIETKKDFLESMGRIWFGIAVK